MGKHGGSMTAAAISKRIKAKGLGRLRWYCQMCEKQCRDENGFKCHTQSASHQRQLTLFAENPDDYIDKFTDMFRREFLMVLRRRYGTSTVHANTVYQECIKDRDHVHMNATKWTTLSDFVKEMGREGNCRTEDREDGWWVSFIDRSAAEKDKVAREMDRQRAAEEEKADILLRQQLQRAREARGKIKLQSEPAESRFVETGPVLLQLHGQEAKKDPRPKPEENALMSFSTAKSSNAPATARPKRRKSRFQDAQKLSAIDEIMLAGRKDSGGDERPSSTQNCSSATNKEPVNSHSLGDYSASSEKWLIEGIVVKVINETIGKGLYRGKKGKVLKVIADYGAQVSMFDSADVLELDQDHLETVIPKPGGKVVVLKGSQRGLRAKVDSVNIESYSVSLTIEGTGELLPDVEYESVSRAS